MIYITFIRAKCTRSSQASQETESIVGVVLCSLMKRNESANNPDEEFELPEKFHKLEKFFEDLKTDFGQRCIFDDLATESVLDIFILATRQIAHNDHNDQHIIQLNQGGQQEERRGTKLDHKGIGGCQRGRGGSQKAKKEYSPSMYNIFM